MKKRRILALFVCLCLLLPIFSGCGIVKTPEDGVTVTKPTRPDIGDGVYNVGSEPLPYTPEELYQQLFDANNKVTINLDMSSGELQKMQDDYRAYRDKGSKSPIYRKTDVVITITTATETSTYRIPEVGIRMKGNTSRTSFYDAAKGIYKYIHFRLDFGETFDNEAYYGSEVNVWQTENALQERKDRTFATLEKLELRWNKCYDSTYLKEIYAYDLYRSEGVLAPRANLSSLDWAGVHMGIYVMVEPIDDVFIQRNLPEADWDGDLYKCGRIHEGATFTNLNSVGIENEDNSEFYVYDLKNNKKTSQHEALTALVNGLNNGQMTRERFAELVDVERFLSYTAVSYFLGNPDDLRHNYNNFYLYFLKSSGKAVFIPYDYDRCLGVTVEYNPSGHAMTRDNPFSEFSEGGPNGIQDQKNPLFLHSVVKGGLFVRDYAAVLTKVSQNELLKPETFEARFRIAEALYQKDVQPGKELENAHGRDFRFDLNRTSPANRNDNMSFKDYITAKLNAFRGYIANVDQYADYVRPIPNRYFIRGDFNDWSNRDEYALTEEDGLWVYTLRFNHEFSFKVYDDQQQGWYGSECLPEDNTVEFTTNDHTNIRLRPGSYKVTFDPETFVITLSEV